MASTAEVVPKSGANSSLTARWRTHRVLQPAKSLICFSKSIRPRSCPRSYEGSGSQLDGQGGRDRDDATEVLAEPRKTLRTGKSEPGIVLSSQRRRSSEAVTPATAQPSNHVVPPNSANRPPPAPDLMDGMCSARIMSRRRPRRQPNPHLSIHFCAASPRKRHSCYIPFGSWVVIEHADILSRSD